MSPTVAMCAPDIRFVFVSDEPRFQIGGAALARQLFDPICDLYDEVFSVPPFFWRDDESELHRERLLGLLEDPTFGVMAAKPWASGRSGAFMWCDRRGRPCRFTVLARLLTST